MTDYGFLNGSVQYGDKTVIGYEIPRSGNQPCYPIVKDEEYRKGLIQKLEDKGLYDTGRFGRAEYLDMDKTILSAMDTVKKIIGS